MTSVFKDWGVVTNAAFAKIVPKDRYEEQKLSAYHRPADFINRTSFLEQLSADSIVYCDKRAKEVICVEIARGDERITQEKFLIWVGTDSIYSQDSILGFQGRPASDIDVWGQDLNEYLIISRFDGKDLTVSPFLTLPEEAVRRIMGYFKEPAYRAVY